MIRNIVLCQEQDMYTYQYQKVDRHQEKLKGFSHAAFHFQRKYLQQTKI